MEDFILNQTDISPEIELSKSRSVFRCSGISLMEDAKEFYEPIISWIKEYRLQVSGTSHFDFQLSDVSQASLKVLLFVFQEIKALEIDGHTISVSWYLTEGDAKMKEIGQDISYMTDVPFDYIFSEKKKVSAELV